MHRLSDCIVSHCGVFFNIILIKQDNCSFPLPCTRMARRQSVCAKRNIVGRKPTSFGETNIIAKHIICTKCNIVHLCPPCGGMMLTFGQTMLCPTDTNTKTKALLTKCFCFWSVLTKKMPTYLSCYLPLFAFLFAIRSSQKSAWVIYISYSCL